MSLTSIDFTNLCLDTLSELRHLISPKGGGGFTDTKGL